MKQILIIAQQVTAASHCEPLGTTLNWIYFVRFVPGCHVNAKKFESSDLGCISQLAQGIGLFLCVLQCLLLDTLGKFQCCCVIVCQKILQNIRISRYKNVSFCLYRFTQKASL